MATPSSRFFFGLIPWYGVLIVLGAGLAVFLADREAKRCRLTQDTILDLALWVLPLGILGARLYYVLFSWSAFQSRPLSALRIWEGGLAIYGGLIAGFLTVVFFCRKRKLSLFLILDLLVPGVVLAQAIGRWGNYFNQEAYGPLLDPSSRFCFFPLAVLIQQPGMSEWHIAAFFLESLWDFCVFLFLIFARRKLFRQKGDIFLFYLAFYGAGRLVIENLRTDSLYLGSGIRVSQLLSVILTLAMLFLLLSRRKRRQGRISASCVISLVPAALSGILSLAFSLGLRPLAVLPLHLQMALLSGYAFFFVSASLILYGPSRPEEVVYAHHQSA